MTAASRAPASSNPRRARKQRLAGKLAAMLAVLLVSVDSQAHPHAWIDVESTIVLSSDGVIAAIEETWVFDELYTAGLMEEIASDGRPQQAALGKFAARVIEDLGPYGYFMRVTADGRPVRLAAVTQFKSEMKGRQLSLSFTAPLDELADPKRHAVQFSVFDPSYFIKMTHRPEAPPSFKNDAEHHCRARVQQPDPSPESILRAFSLDRGATPQDDLGQLFAEKVYIQCG